MESMFHLIEHHWQSISPMELVIYQLARGNTFNTRVIGLEVLVQIVVADIDVNSVAQKKADFR